MENDEEVTIELYQSHLFWFNPASEADRILLDPEPGSKKINFAVEYDYEEESPTLWKVYIDFMLDMETVANMGIRCCFEVAAAESLVFAPEAFAVMMETTLDRTFPTFEEECTAQHLDYLRLETKDFADNILEMAKVCSENYYSSRKPNDAENNFEMIEGMRVSANTLLVLRGTFVVLEQVLMFNPNFDLVHNRWEFSGVIPLSRYNTLKLKAVEEGREVIAFTWAEVVFLLICIDMALQLLVGDHLDTMSAGLDAAGLDEENRAIYLKSCDRLLADMKEKLQAAGVQIADLEDQHDWNAMIR